MTDGITEMLRGEPPQPMPKMTLAYIRENLPKLDVFQRRGVVVLPGGDIQESYACAEGLLPKLLAVAEIAADCKKVWDGHLDVQANSAMSHCMIKALTALESE